MEQKPIGNNDANNPCSVDSQSSTPAIMSLSIGSENEYHLDAAVDDESLKGGQSDFAWIKEKKSSRKQHQGWFVSIIIDCFDLLHYVANWSLVNWLSLLHWATHVLFGCTSHSQGA